jgi:hypothetical protein
MAHKNVFTARWLVIPLCVALLSACGTQMKVASVDEKTGQLKSERGEIAKATVVTAKKMPLAPFKGMAFMSGTSDWGIEQLKAVKYFDQVLSYDDLQKLVIANNLSDKVPSLNEPIGLSKLSRAYKPFLWVKFKQVRRENKTYMQLIATNPENLEDVFVSEVYMDFVWAGVNDQNSRYPLFNAFIAWVNQNKTL